MAAEVDEVVGSERKHNPDRVAKRHGHDDGSMTLGGRRCAGPPSQNATADDERELALGTPRYSRRVGLRDTWVHATVPQARSDALTGP